LEKLVGADGKARPVRQQSRRRKPVRTSDNDWADDDDDDVCERPERLDRFGNNEWGGGPAKTAKLEHAIDLMRMGEDPNSEKVVKLIREASSFVIESPAGAYDPFAGRSDEERREWHVFMLFLVVKCRWSPQGAASHVEWLCQRPFQTVAEWMGDDKWRAAQEMRSISAQLKEAWATFAAAHADQTLDALVAALTTAEDAA
jgi:hypothetical protein